MDGEFRDYGRRFSVLWTDSFDENTKCHVMKISFRGDEQKC
jgi:hypothetical protein